MRITSNLELQEMTTSDRAWCWVGHNYSEEEPALEKLAARFKTVELALKFKNTIGDVLTALQKVEDQRNSELPVSIVNFGTDSHGDEEASLEEYGNEDEGNYGEYDYEDENDDTDDR